MPKGTVTGFVQEQIWQRQDVLRGLLAFYVVLHHAKDLLWPVRNALGRDYGIGYHVNAVLTLITRFGLHAVLIFFLISGMSIHARLAVDPGKRFVRVGDYYWRRAKRLCPALFFSMILAAIIILWSGVRPTFITWKTAIATITFQENILGLPFAGDWPYWSLAYEFYYYLLYPALIFVAVKVGDRPAFFFFGIAGLVLGLIHSPWHAILALYPIWLTGALLMQMILQDRVVPRWLLALGVVVYAASFGYLLTTSARDVSDHPYVWCLTGCSSAAAVYVYLTSRFPASLEGLMARCSKPLGVGSYALYLNHYPVLRTLKTIYAPKTLTQSAWLSLAGIIASLLLAASSYWLVERWFLRPARRLPEATM